jgi:protein gp37
MAARFSGPGQPYEGLATRSPARWTGRAQLFPHMLDQPIRWQRPRRVFVNAMSDLFHDDLTNEEIAAIFGVMASAPQHTFQVLTKRPVRMLDWFRWVADQECDGGTKSPRLECVWQLLRNEAENHPDGDGGPVHRRLCGDPDGPWPLPNVWIGVSVEDQQRAAERIPLLIQTPAAVRFLSVEPMLGPVNLGLLGTCNKDWGVGYTPLHQMIQWVIVGGESGKGAREMRVGWIERIIKECRDADVACFVKQFGKSATAGGKSVHDLWGITKKGDKPEEWPERFRVQQFPDEASW